MTLLDSDFPSHVDCKRSIFTKENEFHSYNLRSRTSLDVSQQWIQFCPTISPYFNIFEHFLTFATEEHSKNKNFQWFAENSFYDLACRRRCRAQDCIRQFAAGGTMTTVDHDYRMAGPSGPSGTRSSHANSLHELNTSATSWRQLAVHCGCKHIWPVNHQHVDLISTGAIYHSLEVKQDSSWWERFMCQSSLSIAVPPGVFGTKFQRMMDVQEDRWTCSAHTLWTTN